MFQPWGSRLAVMANRPLAVSAFLLALVFLGLGGIGLYVDRAALKDQLNRDGNALYERFVSTTDRIVDTATLLAAKAAVDVAPAVVDGVGVEVLDQALHASWQRLGDIGEVRGLAFYVDADVPSLVAQAGEPSMLPTRETLTQLGAGVNNEATPSVVVLDSHSVIFWTAMSLGDDRGFVVAAFDPKDHFARMAERSNDGYGLLVTRADAEALTFVIAPIDRAPGLETVAAGLAGPTAEESHTWSVVHVDGSAYLAASFPLPEQVQTSSVSLVAWRERSDLLATHNHRRMLGAVGVVVGFIIALLLIAVALRLGRERVRSRVDGATRTLRDERELFFGGPVVVFVWRPEPGWPVEYVSPNAMSVLGYSDTEMHAGDFHFASLIHSDDVRGVEDASARAQLDGRASWEQSYRVVRKDGTVRWLTDFTVVDRGADGKVRALRGYLVDQTDYFKLQHELERRARTLDATLSASPAVIYTESVTEVGVTTYISDNVRDILGCEPKDVTGDPQWWPTCLHPDDRDRMAVIGDWRNWTDATVLLSYRFRHADGSWRWIEDHCRIMYDDDGKPLQLVGSLIDVTERVALEVRLDKIASSVPGVIYQYALKADGTVTFPYASEGVARYFGVSPEELKGDGASIFTNVHPDDRELVEASIAASAHTLQPWHCEFRLYRPTGGMVWVEGRAEPERLEDGSILWHGFIIDVSRRKAIEQDLAASRQQLDLAVEGADLAMWDWDIPAERVSHSDRWRLMFGFAPDELSDAVADWESMVHPDDWTEIRANLDAHLAGDTSQYEAEYRLRHCDGHWIWVLDRGKVVNRAADGFPLRAAGTTIDITRQKSTEAALRQREWALALSVRASLELLSGSDLNATINGVLELIGTETGVDRVYVFEVNEPPGSVKALLSQRFEWAREGVSAEIDNTQLQGFPVEDMYPRWVEHFRRGEVLAGHVDSFPETERAMLEEQQIRSMLVVPITLQDRWWGVLGFDSVRARRDWSETEEQILRITAGSIGAAIERMRAEQAIQLSNQRFQLAQRSMAMGVWDWDVGAGVVSWDESMFRIHAMAATEEPMTYLRWCERVHPDDRPRFEKQVRDVLAGRAEHDVEFRILLADGTVRWLQETGFVVRNREGKATRVVGIDVDITDRRLAADALRESELRFRSLFELSPIGVVLSRLEDGRILDVNRAMRDMLDSEADYLRSRCIDELSLAESRQEFGKHRRELLANGTFGPNETVFMGQHGAQIPVIVSGALMTDRHGDRVVWSMVQDISERKRQELALQRLAVTDELTGLVNRRRFLERLEEEYARFTRTGSPCAVLVMDLDYFKRVNDTYGHAVGDDVLRSFASTVRSILRRTDLFGRLGGEEFGLMMPDTEAFGAQEFAGRLRAAVAASPAATAVGKVPYTLSTGITGFREGDTGIDVVLARADRAMYRVKGEGRDGVAMEA